MAKYVLKGNANVRRAPIIAPGNIITVYRKGTVVEPISISGDWAQFFFPAYIHKSLLQEVAPPPPPPPPPPSGWKVGFGAGLERNIDLPAFAKRMSDAGRPIPVLSVLVADGQNMDLFERIHAASPSTYLVCEFYQPAEPDVWNGWGQPGHAEVDFARPIPSGIEWVEHFLPTMRILKPFVKCFELANEWGAVGDRNGASLAVEREPEESWKRDLCHKRANEIGTFYQQAMSRAWDEKFTISCGDFGVGKVEPWWEHILYPMFALAEFQGHPLNYHMYSGPTKQGPAQYDIMEAAQWFAFRWLRWQHRYPGLKIIGLEAGAYHAYYAGNPEAEFEQMVRLNDVLTGRVGINFDDIGVLYPNAENVIGTAQWWLQAHGKWASGDLKDMLPTYEARRKAMPA